MITEFSGKYAFLSNFYPSTFTYKGIQYPTVEHAFQAAKTRDKEMRKMIAGLSTAGKAKQAGRNLKLRPDWEEIKLNMMNILVALKFDDKYLAKKLVETGTERLIEGNHWHDNFWGNCYCNQCVGFFGENHLGMILMLERGKIAARLTK